jgi:hypothetical protein
MIDHAREHLTITKIREYNIMSSYAENEEDAREYAELKRQFAEEELEEARFNKTLLDEEKPVVTMDEILDHRERERVALAQTLKFIQSKLEGNEKVIITPEGIDVRIIDTERHANGLRWSLSHTLVDAQNAADMIQGLGHYPGGLSETNEQDPK